ncbi:MAG: hypothetical protein RIT45_4132 [Pseudomonadota bacterium]
MPQPPTLLMLHGSADSPACWRGVVAAIGDRLRCEAPPLPSGDGTGPDRPALESDLRWLDAQMERTGARRLAAHSYGALLALHWALANPGRLDALLLAEPIAWGVARGDPGVDHVLQRLDHECLDAFRAGHAEAAMAMLVDYWNGDGFWARLPEKVRAGLLAGADRTAGEVASGRTDRTDAVALAALTPAPTMVMGALTTPESRTVTRNLAALAPGARLLVCEGAGHQMLRSHAADVAAALLDADSAGNPGSER